MLVFPQTLIIQNLGTSLKSYTVPNAQNVLKEAWKMVTKVKDSERYMACAESWIYFIVKHFKVNNYQVFFLVFIVHLSLFVYI